MLSKKLVTVALIHVLENQGSKTAGIDGISKKDFKTKDFFDSTVNEIHEELKKRDFKPKAVRRVYIPKTNGDKRPLGIPTIKDRVVQEMIRLLLEPIYECRFHKHSYGFRPYRSTHHAAIRIKDLIGRRGYKWVIEGDLTKCFDNINHQMLIRTIERTITDRFVLCLIKDFLKSGVLEDEQFYATDMGTSQGGIISPLLLNIYLDLLDQKVASWFEYRTASIKEMNRRVGTQRVRFVGNMRIADYQILDLLWNKGLSVKELRAIRGTNESTLSVQLKRLQELGYIEKSTIKQPHVYKASKQGKKAWNIANKMEKELSRRLPCYIVRYADDFVIVTDSYENAVAIKENVKDFLERELSLQLNMDKTRITNADEGFDFLGFNIKNYRKGGKESCLIRPSKKKVNEFKKTIRDFSRKAWSQSNISGMICRLNQMINGWGNYYSYVSSSRVFRSLDSFIWWRVYEDTWDIHASGRKNESRRNHYRKNYIPYRLDMVSYHRWRQGRNFGRYADETKKKAYIVTRLGFLKISYVDLHPQKNPYIPQERMELQNNQKLNKLLRDINRRLPQFESIYGAQWALARIDRYLEYDGKCAICGKKLVNEIGSWEFDVHHVEKFNGMKNVERQNYLNNLLPLCRKCHNRITHGEKLVMG